MAKKLTAEQFEKIIEGISDGQSLKSLLNTFGLHPMEFTDYIDSIPVANDRYARARKVRADIQADDIIDIADNDPDPQRARNRIDVRKWSASKMNPNVYGDRVDINMTQTIDIGSALAEGRARAVLPIIETKMISSSSVDTDTGSQPVDPNENEDDDIFS